MSNKWRDEQDIQQSIYKRSRGEASIASSIRHPRLKEGGGTVGTIVIIAY